MNKYLVAAGVVFGIAIGIVAAPQAEAAFTVVPESETATVRAYLDNYPKVPRKVIRSQAEEKQLLILIEKMGEGDEYEDWSPYLSKKSKEMLAQVPTFTKYLQEPSYKLYNTELKKYRFGVVKGGVFALFIGKTKQVGTGYNSESTTVFVKEDGQWKFDLVGTLQMAYDQEQKKNPQGVYVKGKKDTDLSIVGMEYNGSPAVNDRNATYLVEVKNNGRTKVHKFGLALSINGSDVYEGDVNYYLQPKQSIIVEVPIEHYWDLQGVPKAPGEYRTEVYIGVAPDGLEKKLDDNSYYSTDYFK